MDLCTVDKDLTIPNHHEWGLLGLPSLSLKPKPKTVILRSPIAIALDLHWIAIAIVVDLHHRSLAPYISWYQPLVLYVCVWGVFD